MSLRKDILFDLLTRRVKNPDIIWLSKTIIFNDPTKNFTSKGDRALLAKVLPHKSLFGVNPNQGLPIGNLTSQFFANVYLDEFDQFVKHELKVGYYLRYVDDFLLISRDKEELKAWRKKIELFLKERLALELNSQKEVLQTTDKGIDWLGYIVRPNHLLVRRRIVGNLKQKLFSFNRNPETQTPESLRKMLATINSYFGLFRHANAYNLKKELWENSFGELQHYLKPQSDHLDAFSIKPEFLKSSEGAGE